MNFKDFYVKLTDSQKDIIDEVINTFNLNKEECKIHNVFGYESKNRMMVPTVLIQYNDKYYNTGILLEDVKWR